MFWLVTLQLQFLGYYAFCIFRSNEFVFCKNLHRHAMVYKYKSMDYDDPKKIIL